MLNKSTINNKKKLFEVNNRAWSHLRPAAQVNKVSAACEVATLRKRTFKVLGTCYMDGNMSDFVRAAFTFLQNSSANQVIRS